MKAQRPWPTQQATRSVSYRVFLVDDSPEDREIARRYLEMDDENAYTCTQ